MKIVENNNRRIRNYLGFLIGMAVIILFIWSPVFGQSDIEIIKKKQNEAIKKEHKELNQQNLVDERTNEIIILFETLIREMTKEGVNFRPVEESHIKFLYPTRPSEGIRTDTISNKLDGKLKMLRSSLPFGVSDTFLMFNPVGYGPISIDWSFYEDWTFKLKITMHGEGVGHGEEIELFSGNNFSKSESIMGNKATIKKNLIYILNGGNLDKLEEEEKQKAVSIEAIKNRKICYDQGVLFYKENKYDKAIEQFDRAIRFNIDIIGEPANPTNEELNKAKENVENTVKLRESKQAIENRQKYYLEGTKLLSNGKYLEAVKILENAIGLNSVIIGEPTDPSNNEIKSKISEAENKYEQEQISNGLIDFEGKWIRPEEKIRIEKERNKAWKLANPISIENRFSMGLNWPGVSIREWFPTQRGRLYSLEGRAEFDSGVQAYGLRSCSLIYRTYDMLFYWGGELNYINFKSSRTSGKGYAIYGLLGLEKLVTSSLSFSMDLGPAYVSIGDSKYSVSNTHIVVNLGMNYYMR